MKNKVLKISNYSKGYIKVTCECNSYLIGLDEDILSIVSIESISDDGLIVALCNVKEYDYPLIKWIRLGELIKCHERHCSNPQNIKELKFV